MCQISNQSMRRIGTTLMILGVLSVILGIISYPVSMTSVKHAGGPIWTGVFVGFCGVCAYFAGKAPDGTRNQGWLVAFLTFDIITIIVSFGGWCVAIAVLADEINLYENPCGWGFDYWDGCDEPQVSYSKYQSALALDSICLIVTFVEFVLTFTFSIVGCCAICNTGGSQTQTRVVYQTQTGQQAIMLQPGQQLVQAPGGQGYVIIPAAGTPQQPKPMQQQTYPQPYPQPYQPQPYPQAQPQPYPQAQPQAYPQGQPQPMPAAPYPSQPQPMGQQPTAPPEYYPDQPPAYDETQYKS